LKNIIVLDIGDAKFSAIVVDHNKTIIKKSVIGSSGIYKGVIRDQSSFLRSLNFLMEKLKEKDTKDLIINLQGDTIRTAEIDVSKKYFFKKNKINSKIDNDFANIKTPVNKENIILNYYPQKYFLQGRTIIQTRKVLYTDRLYYDRLKELVKKTGYNMVQAIYPLAVYPVSHKPTAVINLGANTTEIVTYSSMILNEIIHLPLGGELIIKDMIQLTKIDKDKARNLLFSYSKIFSTLKKKSLSHSIHHQIIDSRLKEMFNMIKKVIKSKSIEEVIIIGGLRNLENLPELLGNYLKVRVTIPAQKTPHFYVTSLELARYYFDSNDKGSNAI